MAGEEVERIQEEQKHSAEIQAIAQPQQGANQTKQLQPKGGKK